VAGGQAQAAGIVIEEDGNARDQQRARQLLDDGIEQRFKIGFRTQPAAKLDQRLAVVVAMAVKGAIDPALNAALEGIEDGGRDQNGENQGRFAYRLGHGVVHCHRDERDDAEISAQDKASGQRVGHAALEDQVSVHQPVANDGPTEGERQKDQREAGQIGDEQPGLAIEQKGNGVKEGERPHGQPGAAIEPLQLLAQQGRTGAAVADQEERGRQHVVKSVVAGPRLLQPVHQQSGSGAGSNGPKPEAEQRRARRVERRQQPQPTQMLEALLGEAQREVQKQRRLQRLCGYVEPKNRPVQRVELVRELERVKRERDQAEEIKMRGARRAPAAEENVKPDDEIDQADEAQT
jgi:hypothetical protein